MKFNKFLLLLISGVLSCEAPVNKARIKAEILKTEEDFMKMASEQSISEAFYYFADSNAVIKRENDTLVQGKDAIRRYYEAKKLEGARVEWSPDFVAISDCGNMAYTYGKYIWKIVDSKDSVIEYRGIFQTIWKRQEDQQWKYVWD
ncbi:MAG: nuclear transport factor 2 family protein [Saprospiraceae bacterium]|nr:nuclear transport factor 2 family protein [Saprospiraceae bacterium]